MLLLLLAIHGHFKILANFCIPPKTERPRSWWNNATLESFFSILALVISSPYPWSCHALSSSNNSRGANTNKSYTIKVCQTKTCSQQHQGSGYAASRRPLVRVIQDLIPPSRMSVQDVKIHVESSGCLSQCGNGPNLVVLARDRNETMHNYIHSPQSAAVILQNICGIQIPKILLAASDVMRKAELGE